MIKYREPLFRPPAEADSLIFQVAYGCPHNSCRFCLMFKGVKYELRPLDETLEEISEAGSFYPGEKRIFLADGDVMALPFDMLYEIFRKINESFPSLARINIYANGSSILDKSEDQLNELRKLRLNTVYMGLESGDQELLDNVNKGENVRNMTDAVQLVQGLGIKASVMILLGLAGKKGSEKHAAKSAEALNFMQPRLLSALRFIEFPGKTKMFKGYEPCTEYDAVRELHNIISLLELKKTVFRANHSSNPLPLSGRFPQDRKKLLRQVEGIMNSGVLDCEGPGNTPFFL